MKAQWYYSPLIAGLALGVDQLTKYLVVLKNPDLVTLNTAGSWGLLPAWSAVIGIVFLGVFLVYQPKGPKLLWFILGAGLSNILDRLLYGGVIDFISISKFPTFNVADAFISVSAGWLVIQELYPKRQDYVPKN